MPRRLIRVVLFVCACMLALPTLASAKTVVSIEFDDGVGDAYQALSALKAHGLHGTFFINSGRIGETPIFMNWAQVHDLYNAGNEIGGHTVLHANLLQVGTGEQQREICNDRVNLLNQGFPVTDFAFPYGAGAKEPNVRQIVYACGYDSARDVSGVYSPDYGCGNCDPSETIPPQNPYDTRAPQSVVTRTSVREMQNYVRRAQQSGGGWIQLVFHHICSYCDPYAVKLQDFKAIVAWLAQQQASGALRVATVHQVLGGSVRPALKGPLPPVPSGSDLVWNPWFNNWKKITSGGEGSSRTLDVPMCFQAGHWGTNQATLTRVQGGPPGDPNGAAAQLQVTGYTRGAAEIITTQLDLGSCNPTLKVGKRYKITAWYKSNAPVMMLLFDHRADGAWEYWTEGPVLQPTTTWTKFTLVTPGLPAGYTAVSFGMGLKSDGTLQVDGYQLRPTADDSTVRVTKGAKKPKPKSSSDVFFNIAGPLAVGMLILGLLFDLGVRRRRKQRQQYAIKAEEAFAARHELASARKLIFPHEVPHEENEDELVQK